MKKLLFILLLFISTVAIGQNSPLVPAQGGVVTDYYIGNLDQYLTTSRLLSGGDSYNLTLDSIPQFNLYATEVYITEDTTTFANLISTTNRWNTANSGLIFQNQGVGFNYTWLQEVYNDSIARVSLAPGAAVMQVLDREGAGTTYYSGSASVKADEIWLRTADPSDVTDAEVRVGFGRVEINGTDSTILRLPSFNEALTLVVAIDTTGDSDRLYMKTVGASAGSISYDTYSSGAASALIARFGGTAVIVTNPSTGTYDIEIPANANVHTIDFIGNNTILSGGQLTLTIDNSANSRDRIFMAQLLYSTGGQVDHVATSTTYTQTTSGNITTIIFPNMNGFGGGGYTIMLR